MFIGRNEELNFLTEKYKSNKAEFIVMYGRRRIGKTELLREFVKDKKHVFYSAHQILDQMQLNRVTRVLTTQLNAKIYSDSFGSWENVFSFISEHANQKEKLVLVFDEFPYMVEGNRSIPSILQSIWDINLSKLNVMIVICGSSMSFIEKEILSEKNPLYGRTTGIMKIREMDFESTKDFYSGRQIEEQVTLYSVFSGVPYYLNFISEALSIEDNIKKNILSNNTVLFNEVEFLLKQELREVSVYNAVITAVALGRTKHNEIVQLTGIEKTKLSYYLNSLIDLGIIIKEFPCTIKAKEMPKSRMGIYKLDNSYFNFYYRFVYPYYSELVEGNIEIIYEDIISKQMNDFIGLEFEKIAVQMMKKMNMKNDLPIRCLRIGRWWNKQTEIDIVGYDYQNNFIFGECKWRNEKVGIKTLRDLQNKSIELKTAKEKYYILFSKAGFTDELIEQSAIEKGIKLIDFKGL